MITHMGPETHRWDDALFVAQPTVTRHWSMTEDSRLASCHRDGSERPHCLGTITRLTRWLALNAHCTALSCTLWSVGYANSTTSITSKIMILTSDLLNPKPKQFTFVPRCTGDKNLEKIRQGIPEISQKQTPKMVLSAYLVMMWPSFWTFWTQNRSRSSLSQEALLTNVWWKSTNAYHRHCRNNIRHREMHARTLTRLYDTKTWQWRRHNKVNSSRVQYIKVAFFIT